VCLNTIWVSCLVDTCFILYTCGDDSVRGSEKPRDRDTIFPVDFQADISCRSIFPFDFAAPIITIHTPGETREYRIGGFSCRNDNAYNITSRGWCGAYVFHIIQIDLIQPNHNIARWVLYGGFLYPRVLSRRFRSPARSRNPQYPAVVNPRNATRAHPAPHNITPQQESDVVHVSMSHYNAIFSPAEPIANFADFRGPRATRTGSGAFEMTRCALTSISLKPIHVGRPATTRRRSQWKSSTSTRKTSFDGPERLVRSFALSFSRCHFIRRHSLSMTTCHCCSITPHTLTGGVRVYSFECV